MAMVKNSPDPEIKFTCFHCPLCGNEAGPKSNCYEHKNKDKAFTTSNGNFLNVFSPSCVFRAEYMYYADINYPFSEDLMRKLVDVVGLSKIIPVGPYRFQINIGSLFKPEEVKKNIALTYRVFVKEILARNRPDDKNFPKKMTIVLPNGEKFVYTPSNYEEYIQQKAVIDNLLEDFPSSQVSND